MRCFAGADHDYVDNCCDKNDCLVMMYKDAVGTVTAVVVSGVERNMMTCVVCCWQWSKMMIYKSSVDRFHHCRPTADHHDDLDDNAYCCAGRSSEMTHM